MKSTKLLIAAMIVAILSMTVDSISIILTVASLVLFVMAGIYLDKDEKNETAKDNR